MKAFAGVARSGCRWRHRRATNPRRQLFGSSSGAIAPGSFNLFVLPAIHGGMTGAFLETTAIVSVTREPGALALPKPIGLTINYLRSGRALDSYAKASIVKQGRRVVAFEAQAWQDDPCKPIASAFGHFMLRRTPDVDEE